MYAVFVLIYAQQGVPTFIIINIDLFYGSRHFLVSLLVRYTTQNLVTGS
jgi:predicted signal transduction protein with EAL and GGDEF domain